MDTFKIDGIQTGIYLIKYSNLYPFLYVLKNAFGNSVKVLDWDPYFPDIDRSVELNVFLGTDAQIREWLSNEQFCFTKLLTYKHKYFFVNTKHSDIFKNIRGKCKQTDKPQEKENDYNINIFTNVTPVVERFKKKEILDIIFKNGYEKLKEITVIEEDILFSRDFVAPIINRKDNQNEIDVFFYGTPLNDILLLYSPLDLEKLNDLDEKTKNELKQILEDKFKDYWKNIKGDLKLAKFETDLKEDTYLCFMVNTGKIQPKHLSLISKLVELFEMCNDLFKDKDKDKDKDFTFLIEEDGEDSSNSGNGLTVKEKIEIKFVKKEKKIIVEKIFIDSSDENSEVLRGRIRGALSGKANGRVGGRLSGTIFGEFCKSKMGKSSDSKSQTIKITGDTIVKAFKQSFNLRFLPDPIVKVILQLSLKHNDVPSEKNFGCSVEDLEDNNEQNNQENNNKGTAESEK